ncbi:TetR/AcrR family transcriptional regulator [Streptomyces sp. NPDC057702]|uniref:TetR/AcrR family transcriptional regulator n=1 Tax=unclassified Streptomyces TaxID=2593676 RepID=UPI0036CAE3B0
MSTQTGATPDTRTRIVRAASLLMQRQGYDGTGIKQIAQEAQATLGSVYHFFPGGKQELAVAAIHHGDQEFFEVLQAALDHGDDPAQAVATLCHTLAEGLCASAWLDGCPITATSLGTAGRAPDIQQAAAQAFARWRGLVRDRLRATGVSDADAHDLAHTVISTIEGAELAAQVAQSREPLEAAGKHLAQLITLHR